MLIRLPTLILSLSLALAGCAGTPKIRTVKDPEWIKHRVVVSMLERYYYKEIDRDKCVEAMLKGGVSECTDPHSYYADAEIELAFGTLFGPFGRAFFRRYGELRPIRAGSAPAGTGAPGGGSPANAGTGRGCVMTFRSRHRSGDWRHMEVAASWILNDCWTGNQRRIFCSS